MTALPFFQVDAFAERPLTGNPAAVMPLDRWLDDEMLQAIAAENNLSETAFTVPSEGDDADYELRWFTPTSEVELCGHATLAAGHVLIHAEPLRFATRKAGVLTVGRRGDRLELDLPAARAARSAASRTMTQCDGHIRRARMAGRRLQRCRHRRACRRGRRPGGQPRLRGAPPNPSDGGRDRPRRQRVTSPAGCSSPISASTRTRSPARPMPRWRPIGPTRLGCNEFTALQASARTGLLNCRLEGDRVMLGGRCFTVIAGQFQL